MNIYDDLSRVVGTLMGGSLEARPKTKGKLSHLTATALVRQESKTIWPLLILKTTLQDSTNFA